MNKQKGISQIFVMVIMLILAIALPVTANLVKKVQDNRSSAAVSSCSSKGGACVTSYTGMSSGITCSGSSGGTNGGTTNTSYSCLASDGSSSGKVCCVPNSSNSTSGSAGIGSGAEACVAKSGACQTNGGHLPDINTACSVNGKTGTYQTNLCVGQYNSGYRCCVPNAVVAVCTTGAKRCNANNTVDVCSDRLGGWTFSYTCSYGCESDGSCKNSCVGGAKQCSGDYIQVCISDSVGAFWQNTGSLCQYGCSAGVCKDAPTPAPVVCTPNCACAANTLVGQTCSNGCSGTCAGTKPAPVNGALGPANGTIVTTKPTSSGACSAGSVDWTDDIATDSTYNWTCAGINGGTSVSGSATKADCTIDNQKCTTNNKYYTCTDGLWAHSTTLTACSGSKVCINGDIGTAVCKEPDYVAPKLNMFFAISGVKKNDACFGDLKFKVNVNKDGVSAINREVAATVVTNSFNKNGDQVFKIADFALDNSYALTDKMKISIGGKKTLATIYGKDNQVFGFPALNTSNILVSNLVNKTLTFYDYPILNGDIGAQGVLGTQDNVVNGIDFAFMKNEWGKTCNAGENLVADLNGDCRVDTFDLQILKNAMGEQYAQKTD